MEPERVLNKATDLAVPVALGACALLVGALKVIEHANNWVKWQTNRTPLPPRKEP